MASPELSTLATIPWSFMLGLLVVQGMVISTSTAVPISTFSRVFMKIPCRVKLSASAEKE
jgi:hypothetical protein